MAAFGCAMDKTAPRIVVNSMLPETDEASMIPSRPRLPVKLAGIAAIALSAAFPLGMPTTAHSGEIERACTRSDRVGGNTRLCTCIQRVADQLLTAPDQRLAASFFKDPHRAQEVRQSDSTRDERFWTRYRQFGALAEQSCR